MDVEWDAEKARRSFAKHGVTFEEAATVFSDPFEITVFDPGDFIEALRGELLRMAA